MNIPKMCAYAGCYRRAVDGTSYCAEHQGEQRARDARKAERNKANMQKLHDAWRQDGRHKLYNTARWRTMRAAQLKAYPQCKMCGRPATSVDHITPHLGREEYMYDTGNLQSLCHACHMRKTKADAQHRKEAHGV
jgi:5-methylcytosine-specific restriction enzyme A